VDDHIKDIIMSSLRFLSHENRVTVYGFVIMDNHLHAIWQIMEPHARENVQRDFLKFTSQKILAYLRKIKSPLMLSLEVNAMDRKFQVWERNSLSIPLFSLGVLEQKLNYIHDNPVRAGLCKEQHDFKYSSAAFYLTGLKTWDFLVHHEG